MCELKDKLIYLTLKWISLESKCSQESKELEIQIDKIIEVLNTVNYVR